MVQVGGAALQMQFHVAGQYYLGIAYGDMFMVNLEIGLVTT